MNYLGKPLSDYNLLELGEILTSLNVAEQKREEASKHEKFKKMKFPPINPEFLKLKEAVQLEIRKKQINANN